MVWGQTHHAPEVVISTIHDEPPSSFKRTWLSIQPVFRSGYRLGQQVLDRVSRRLPIIVPALFFAFVFGAQAQEVSAVLRQQAERLSYVDSERVSLVLSDYLEPVSLRPTLDEGQFAAVAIAGEVIGGLESTASSTTNEMNQRRHVVASGETISTIAEKYDLRSGSVMLANSDIQDSERISIGQVLIIPDQEASEEALAAEYEARQKKIASEATQKSTVASKKAAKNKKVLSSTSKASGFLTPTRYRSKSRGFSASHPGDDLAASTGTPVVATKDGCIVRAAKGWNGGYGNVILLDVGGGYTALYGHLSRFAEGLSQGDCYDAGEVIGYIGSTGRSTGPHLHFEIRKNGVQINPNM